MVYGVLVFDLVKGGVWSMKLTMFKCNTGALDNRPIDTC